MNRQGIQLSAPHAVKRPSNLAYSAGVPAFHELKGEGVALPLTRHRKRSAYGRQAKKAPLPIHHRSLRLLPNNQRALHSGKNRVGAVLRDLDRPRTTTPTTEFTQPSMNPEGPGYRLHFPLALIRPVHTQTKGKGSPPLVPEKSPVAQSALRVPTFSACGARGFIETIPPPALQPRTSIGILLS